jgi:hypothetical protein
LGIIDSLLHGEALGVGSESVFESRDLWVNVNAGYLKQRADKRGSGGWLERERTIIRKKELS